MIVKVADKREQMNLTQEQLAQKLMTDRSTVAKWETGKSFPRLDMLVKLTQIFGCTADELLGIERKSAEAEEEVPTTRAEKMAVNMSAAFSDAKRRSEAVR